MKIHLPLEHISQSEAFELQAIFANDVIYDELTPRQLTLIVLTTLYNASMLELIWDFMDSACLTGTADEVLNRLGVHYARSTWKTQVFRKGELERFEDDVIFNSLPEAVRKGALRTRRSL